MTTEPTTAPDLTAAAQEIVRFTDPRWTPFWTRQLAKVQAEATAPLQARIAELEAAIVTLKDAETAWVANRLNAAAGSEADKAAAALYALLAPAQEEPR